MTLDELRTVIREAERQRVPIKIEIGPDWLTFIVKDQPTLRRAVSLDAIEQARYPVGYCTNHLHSLLADIASAR